MLLSFSLRNFFSFAEHTQVSLLLNQRDTVSGWDRPSPTGARVTTALGMLGANGAGKTNLLKAVPFLVWFMRDSFALKPKDHINFLTHQAKQNEPAEFELEADSPSGTRWKYELKATPERVLHESLHRKSSDHGARYSYVFIRDWNGTDYDVKQQGFGLAETEAVKVRPNVSLIAWAKQYGANVAMEITGYELVTNLGARDRNDAISIALMQAAEFYSSDNSISSQMKSLIKSWDLGLSDVVFRSFETPDIKDVGSSHFTYPMGIHKVGDLSFELPFAYESSGTQTAFLLLRRLLPVLAKGGVAFIDELESDLHPHMIEPILRLFHDEETNPHGAQIIFTCHSPEVLKLLHRAQVMFVEKTDCISTAYRGDEIEGLTSAHNLYAKYMSGALGAVPQV